MTVDTTKPVRHLHQSIVDWAVAVQVMVRESPIRHLRVLSDDGTTELRIWPDRIECRWRDERKAKWRPIEEIPTLVTPDALEERTGHSDG